MPGLSPGRYPTLRHTGNVMKQRCYFVSPASLLYALQLLWLEEEISLFVLGYFYFHFILKAIFFILYSSYLWYILFVLSQRNEILLYLLLINKVIYNSFLPDLNSFLSLTSYVPYTWSGDIRYTKLIFFTSS